LDTSNPTSPSLTNMCQLILRFWVGSETTDGHMSHPNLRFGGEQT
jgi:hypothetical protein